MKHLYKILFMSLLLATSFVNAQVSVTATAGTISGSYTTLKEAFDSINSGYHQDVIQISLTANTVETASAKLIRSGVGAALYTSVLIKPTTTVLVTGTIAGALLHLSGAQNVTIDGSVGSGTNDLTFTNSSTATNTVTIQISSRGSGLGAQSDTIKHCNISNGGFAGGFNTFGIFIGDSTITNTATGINNNYIGIINNKITNCRYGIYNRGVTTSSATYNKSVYIAGNTIGSKNDAETVSFVGIDCRNNDSLKIVNNNIVGMVETAVQAVVRGMDLGGNIINSTIDGNFIDNIRHTSNTLFRSGQGIFLATVLGSNNTISNNVISNLNGHGSATITNNAWGIVVSTGGNIKILFNTIALTGSAVTTGSADLSGCLLLNSAASTLLEVRGNIFFNTRSPGNNTTGFSRNMHSVSTAVNLTINHNIYYVPPSNVRFQVGLIGGVSRLTLTDWQTGTAQDANSLNALPGIASTSVGRCLVSPSSPAINAGPTGTAITTDILGTTRSLTPTIGAYETGITFSDLNPTIIYTLGKLPIPYANPHQLRASITNLGNDTAMASKVYVGVNGANSILDSLIMTPIAPGAVLSVDMPQYSYTNFGVDTVTIMVENDSNNLNNSVSLIQVINSNTYSYAEPFRPADGGVGFTGATGDFVAKFPYTGSNSINQIGVNFSAGGQTLSIGIWDTAVTGAPGTNLWTSTPFVTTAGLNTIVVNPPIPITGSFFVGVRQTGTVNASFSFQSEAPIRSGTFYFTSPTGSTTWTDFAPNNPFRFMIEPRLQDADDIGAESVVLPCLTVIEGSPAFSPIVTLFNFGANAQSSFIVQSSITGPVNYNSSDTFTGGSFTPGSSVSVNLANTFNPTTAGVYTMKVWTQLAGDLQAGNDTFTYQFNVSNVDLFTNSGNQLTLAGSNQSATVNGSGSLNITGSMLSIEAWVKQTVSGGERYLVHKDNDLSSSGYSLLLNATGNLVFRFTTSSGLDSVVSTTPVPLGLYAHVAATYNGILGETYVYINGEEKGFKVIILPLVGNTLPLYIGRGTASVGGYFGGSIDELKIWDTTRTAVQIREGLHTRLGSFAHANLKAYWHMDESTGFAIADASGNCNAGFLGNGGTFVASEIPLGAPTIYSQPVLTSGTTTFSGANMDLTIYNQSGNNEYYIHKFTGAPEGTSPALIPGGVANIHPNNWIVYRYGTGTMDSAEVVFNTNGITLAADPNDFFLYGRSTGSLGGWVLSSTASAINPSTGLVTFTTLASNYNNQFVVGANNNPLPVTLLYLKATRQQSDARIAWSTASETENAGFDIQRSTDGKTFVTIGFVKGNGTKASASGYAYTDVNAFKTTGASTVYYRLAQKDFNGKIIYSTIVSVGINEQTTTSETVFPNPFTDGLYIETAGQVGSMLELNITDLHGKTIRQSRYTIPASGLVDITEMADLSKGIYFLQMQTNMGQSISKIAKL